MSILIKGMEKPKSCESCPFEDFGGCMFRVQKEDCPLVEVSTPHGRLIDADEYINRMSNRYEEYMYDVLDEMPTIIEAEED